MYDVSAHRQKGWNFFHNVTMCILTVASLNSNGFPCAYTQTVNCDLVTFLKWYICVISSWIKLIYFSGIRMEQEINIHLLKYK